MRPIKLVMSAFGPYAKRQVIDFEKLEGQNIFLITGPTGAGKTTIFDAISYALFGEASGSTREVDSLRSDFADTDVETSVELEFEFREKVYNITRIPKQMKKKLRGEGFTEKSADGQLELPDGKVISGYSNVSAEVKKILGIDENQFKQIVMLPQGEFKKLLLAKSSEKEEVFRKIFGTQNFQRFQNLLKDKADKIYKEVAKSEDEVKTNLKGVKSFDYKLELGENIDYKEKLDEVKKLIEKDKNREKEVKVKIERLDAEIEKITLEYKNASSINELINKRDILEKEVLELKSKKDEYLNKEARLRKGSKYLEVLPVDNAYEEKKHESINKEKGIIILEKSYEETLKKREIIIEELKSEESKEEERKEISREILELEGKRSKFEELESKEFQLGKLQKDNLILIEAEKVRKKELELLKSKKDINEKQIQDINEAKLKEKDISSQKEIISKKRNDLLAIYKSINKYDELTEVHNKNKEEYLKVESKWKKVKEIYEEQDELYRSHQAGILAKNLNEGEPCPVCGSKNHPNKAVLIEAVLTEEQLKEAKEKVANLEELRNNALLIATESNKTIATFKEEVVQQGLKETNQNYGYDFTLHEGILQIIIEEGKVVKGVYENLLNEHAKVESVVKTEEDTLKEKYSLQNRVNELEIEQEKEEIDIRDISGKLEAIKSIVAALRNELPQKLNSLKVFDETIKMKKNKLKEMEEKLKEAQRNKESIEKEVSGLEYSIKNEKKNLIEINLMLNKSKDKLDTVIINSGFENYDDYINCKITVDESETLKVEIDQYKSDIKVKEELLRTKQMESEGLVRINLFTLEERIKETKEDRKTKEKLRNEIYSYITNNQDRYEEATKLRNRFIEKENEYRILGELSKLATGKIKPYITFESYVLAAYFQEIINSANIRLRKMTNERYILKRKEDNFKGAGQKGLDLEVFDNNTGKLRNVSSLSGGETFKASLALALGLSDVIQSTSGGIKLDTMFIDEGFGTLDPESLDNAIDTLLELQNDGRLVGIISHVNELKETIEKQLIITCNAKGSVAEFI